MKPAVIVLAVAALAATARADSFDPRVMVMPTEGSAPATLGKLGDDVLTALADGAATTAASVARATASLADTAVIVGCEPEAPGCADAVAAALNVDQLLIARLSARGTDASVEITAITREAEPVTETFPVRAASRDADLAAIRDAVPRMLEEGEARRTAGTPPPPPPEPDPVPLPPAGREDAPRSRLPLAVVIGGGVVLAVGLTSWALAASTQGEIDDAPTSSAADLDALAALEDRAALRANVGNVLVIVGAVTAAAGGVWWWRDRQTHASVAVTAVPGGAGVAIGGAW